MVFVPNALSTELSEAGFLKKLGGRSALSRFLRRYAKADYMFQFYDFTENAAIGDYMLSAAGSGGAGAATFAIPSTKAIGGTLECAIGTTDDGSQSLIGPLLLTGATNGGMEVRIKSSAVASNQLNLECGLIDAVPGANASGVSDVDTPAAAFTNGAMFTIDGDQTLKALAFVSKGNASSQAIQSTTATLTTGLTADTYTTFSVQLVQSGTSSSIAHAIGYINGYPEANHSPAAGAVNGATLLAPWVYARTRDTTAKTISIDYIAYWSLRAA